MLPHRTCKSKQALFPNQIPEGSADKQRYRHCFVRRNDWPKSRFSKPKRILVWSSNFDLQILESKISKDEIFLLYQAQFSCLLTFQHPGGVDELPGSCRANYPVSGVTFSSEVLLSWIKRPTTLTIKSIFFLPYVLSTSVIVECPPLQVWLQVESLSIPFLKNINRIQFLLWLVVLNLASLLATLRSHARAISKPPPRATWKN